MPETVLNGAELLALIIALVWAIVFVQARRGIRLTPVVEPGDAPPEPTHAFVPARNEVEVIEASLRSLCRQPGLSAVTVVDDQSTDGTSELLGRLSAELSAIQVVQGHGPGPGACGKPAALVSALAASPPQSDWLLFLDADVILEPGALSGLFELQRRHGADLVSVLPRLELPTLTEELAMPAVAGIITARHRPEWVNDSQRPEAFANGQLILVRREAYEKVGGHAAVISEVLEDVQLASKVKAAGYRLLIADGRKVARTRMYASFAEMVEGWSKNLFLLVGSSVPAAIGWSTLAAVLGAAPILVLILGGWPLGVVGYGLILSFQVYLRRLGGVRAPAALLAPVGAALAAYLLLRSTWIHRRGHGIAWKGRRYDGRAG